jgi:ubiquinone/menaquinone biosynthesis C-methylase UbiE
MDGASGWDDYAPFYDWENARTLGRRDVAFWRRIVAREAAPTLELGCGTGRLLMPLARTGARMTGVDLSAPMLARAVARRRRVPVAQRPGIVRADIRALPFPAQSFGVVVAPYGMLQSLLRDRDLDATLHEAARVLRKGGLLGIDLVPDLPAWNEYGREVRLRGRAGNGRTVTLVESVRQDRRRGVTIFDEEFIETIGRRRTRHRFSLTFRTITLARMAGHLTRAGFEVEAMSGSYRGDPLGRDASAWIVEARTRI